MGGWGRTPPVRPYTLVRLGLTGEQGRDRFLHPLTPPRTGAVRTALAKGVLTLRGHPRSPFGRFTPKQGLSPMKLIPRNAFVGGFAVFWMSPGELLKAEGPGSPCDIARLYRFLPLYVRGWRDARRRSRALLGPGTRLAILQDTPVWMGGLGATIGERNSDGSARLVHAGRSRPRNKGPASDPQGHGGASGGI